MLSFSTPESAVRSTVSAISSAIDSSVFLNSSKPIGSRGVLMVMSPSQVCRSNLPAQLDRDVAVWVQHRARARRNHARGVVLLDDARASARRGQTGTVEDRCLAPAETRSEIHAAPRRVATARPVDADRLRNARPIRNSLSDHAKTDDLDGLVRPGAVAVGPLVLLAERLGQRRQRARVDR